MSVVRSSLVADVDFFPAARTVATIFFPGDVDFFLPLVVARSPGGKRRILTFPSDALLSLRKVNLSLDVSLGDCLGVVPVRRREDADWNRYSGVKVQVDECSVRELFSNAFRRAERKTRRGLLLLVKEGEGRERGTTLLNSSFN